MWAEVLLVGLVGGGLALDRAAAFQFMVSRPLVAGPITGLILASPGTGLTVGLLMELIWTNRLPLGGHIPHHDCLASVMVTAAAVLAAETAGLPTRTEVVLAFLIGLPVGRLGALGEHWLRQINGIWPAKARARVEAGKIRGMLPLNLGGLAVTFLGAFVFIVSLLPVLICLQTWLKDSAETYCQNAFEWLFLVFPLIGMAVSLSRVNVKHSPLIFGAAFYLVFLLNQL